MENGIGYVKSKCAGSTTHSVRANSGYRSFNMMLCINRHENYTRISLSSFKLPVKF